MPRRDRFGDERDDYGDDYPPRRRQSGNQLAIILVVLGGVAIVGLLVCGGLFFWVVPRGAAPPAANVPASAPPDANETGHTAGQEPKIAPNVTAIDVLLAPDDVMIDRARAANARLRADYPKGFALDADHAPHVTVIQRFVRTSDLDKVYAAVANVSKDENPTEWELKATGYYDIPVEKTGVAGIVIEPTKDLLRLQQKVIDAVAPYTADKGTEAAFAPKPDGGAFAPGLVEYVAGFVPKSSGKNYDPHVSIGVGTREFLDKLKAEPFKSFTFKARAVAVYQLGDFGTAQKLLWTSAPRR
jgi:2'-5' RNA ligase superfamily